MSGFDPMQLFSFFEMETDSRCNLKCAYCPNAAHKRGFARLEMSKIREVIAELQSLDYAGGFSPHFYNEPLLDERMPEIVHLARTALPKATIYFFSNFTLMNKELYAELYPNVDQFIVSIDEKIIKDAVAKLLQRIDPAMQDKLKTRSLSSQAFSNRAGSIPEPEPGMKRPQSCYMARGYLTLDAKGYAHLCCNDYFGRAVYGNIHEKSLLEIWRDPAYAQARLEGYAVKHKLCAGCLWS